MSNCGSTRLPLIAMLGLVFVITIQLADNRYIPYTPYYPVQPYHEGGAGYMGNGPPPLRGMIPYDHYQPVWTPHGTFFDQRRKVLRVFPGGGVPVIVDYDKRCSDGFIGVKKHPDHAQYYYACKSDCVIFGKCQDYQYFDANKGQCIPYPLPRFAPVCTKPGHFPVYSNCTLYYTCDCNLNSEIFSCPSGTIFSSAQGLCIDGRQCPPTEIAQGSYIPENCEQKYPPCLENGTFRSPMDCGLYYKCAKQANGVFLQTRFKCPGDNFYDTTQKLCLPQQQVSCDRMQIAHLVYPGASQKSYSPNYYPYVADSEEATDFTVAQPKRIDCSVGTTPNTSGEEIESESQVVQKKPARIDQSQQISGTTELTSTSTTAELTTTTTTTTEPTTTTTMTVITTTNQPTQPQITTSSTPIAVQPQTTTTAIEENVDDDTTSSSTTLATSTSGTSSTSNAPVTSTTSATTNSEISTTEPTSTATPQLEITTPGASTGTSTVEDTSTTVAGSSPTSTGTTDGANTTNQVSTNKQTATPTDVSTTEAISTTNSVSTTEDKSTTSDFGSTTDEKSTTNNFVSTTELRPAVTTELTTIETENTEDTSISTTQTGTSTTNNEDTSTTNDSTEGIERASLDASTPSPMDTQAKTQHASNTNTQQPNTDNTKPIPHVEVLRDSRSIDHDNKTKTPEDSDGCCSQERMVLDDELILDDSEEYDSQEEMESNEIETPNSLTTSAIATSVIRDNSVQNTATTENISHIKNTTQKHEISDVQSTTQTINSANDENEVIKSHERRVLSNKSVITTTTASKIEQTVASTTEANKIATTEVAPSSATENDGSGEEYDSQEYVYEESESTTTSTPLEQSTMLANERTFETSTVNSSSLSTTIATDKSGDDLNVNDLQILRNEVVLTTTTQSTPTTEANDNATTEEYDSVEYLDEDDTTTSSNSIAITTEAPRLLADKADNIMIVAKNEHPIVTGESAEMLANVVEISTARTNTTTTTTIETPMRENEIEGVSNERHVLSDEVVLNTTTIPSTTPIPEVSGQVTTQLPMPTSTTEVSFEYESNEIDDGELEESIEANALSNEVIVPTTPITTQIPITTTATESSTVALTTENSVQNTTEESILSYEDFEENDVNYEQIESQEKPIPSDDIVATTTASHSQSAQQTSSTLTPHHLQSSEQTDTTETTTIPPRATTTTETSTSTEGSTTQIPNDIPQSDNNTHERLVLSDEIVIGTTPSQIQNEIETHELSHTPTQVSNTNTDTNTNTTQQVPQVSTFSDIRQINLHMRETQNTTATHQKPVNNTNIIIGEGTCIENPNIPTLNLTIYGDINLHIRFCPRPCNETHVHNYEKLPIVDAVWDSNSSNKTMNLQAIS